MKKEFYLPNYKNGSIVNLMSSIKESFGGKSQYRPLRDLSTDEISGKNIVLVVIDGLGYEYIKKYGRGSFLHDNLKGRMTSVFPATTASAITSFMTGVAPAQHALTGWFMYLKEIGSVSVILPFTARAGNISLSEKIKYEDIYDQKSFFEDLEAKSFSLKHKDYSDSVYSVINSKGAKRLAYSDLVDFIGQIEAAIKRGRRRKFALAYWGNFDSICHRKGTDSKEALKHFFQLDKKIANLAKSLKGKNTSIIITADHGLINTKEKDKIIKLEDHPELSETLVMPLSGEPRAVYCYVRPDKVKQFENYVRIKLKKACYLYKSEDLIRKNYFGLHRHDERLKDRIGDYVLIMKDNFIMKDFVLGEKQNIYIGNHGGLSCEEMFVPLIVI
ncbi:MAG: alkaline phosphatase family protein [Candidatus Moranbacteria bacterium]|nr:alkaline phosphatase family protein [Candidatus Moranbacteria bacterium]MDD5652362.1 alkaline phosphatase family protein [Candidatus Moranbacteria bacterium]MDX9855707.1 alkaline phosphatase family protein [Candidatus Moranbacteria bacterium]